MLVAHLKPSARQLLVRLAQLLLSICWVMIAGFHLR
jgi:hypothetical protein